MLYDPSGRPIPDNAAAKPVSGQTVWTESSDREAMDVSRGLDPARLDLILTSANDGDTADQCRLAAEIEEKNWDVFHALQTRRNAVLGIEYTIEPPEKDDSPAAKKNAEAFADAIDAAGDNNGLDSFYSLRVDLMDALLPGFAASELVWLPGGGIAGFSFIEQRHFHFMDGFKPKLITRDSAGIELPPNKLVLHRYRRRGSDPARGGLIRPLAWLHCFSSVNIKDLLRFVERYGMPFAVAKVDQTAWDNDRDVIKAIIRNFGPNGGGVFSKAVEMELIQAANNSGKVYFDLLKYIGDAITKVVLGQTAASGDAGGWSNGSPQSEVRQDILEYDCAALAATIDQQLIAPWHAFNCAPGSPVPRIVFHCQPPEDTKSLAENVKILSDAGFEADPEEMSERFGIKLTRKAAAVPDAGAGTGSAAVSSASPKTANSAALAADPSADTRNAGKSPDGAENALEMANKWLTPLADAIAAAAEDPDLLGALTSASAFDTSAGADLIAETIFTAAAGGVAAAAATLKNKEK